MLELAILGLLKNQDLHGYELKKRLVDMLGVGSAVSFGSLYPALRRLEQAGAVTTVEGQPSAPRIPMTGSIGGELAAFRARKGKGPGRGGRNRKVYSVTARGDELFAELLSADTESSRDDRSFNLRLAFARYLPPEARLGLLERRRAYLLERLGRLGARLRAGRAPLDSYGRSLVDHDREATEHDISWIESLIATERRAPGGEASTSGAAVPYPEAEAGSPTPPSGPTPAHRPAAPARDRGSNPRPEQPAPPRPVATIDRPSLSGVRAARAGGPGGEPSRADRGRADRGRIDRGRAGRGRGEATTNERTPTRSGRRSRPGRGERSLTDTQEESNR